MFKRRKRFGRAVAEAPDSTRIWHLDEPQERHADPLEAAYDAVYAAIEDEHLDDDLVELLARVSPLVCGRPAETIPAATAAAMHAAAAVGYLSRGVLSEGGEVAELARAEEIDSDGELAEAAARLAADSELAEREDALRERTLTIVVRKSDSGGLISPDGPVADVTLDDFRRAWTFGFAVAELTAARERAAVAQG